MKAVEKVLKMRRYSDFASHVIECCQKAESKIIILSPYIKEGVLNHLLGNVGKGLDITIITDWNEESINNGSLDMSLFNYCKEKNFTFKSLDKLHAKIWTFDDQIIITSSANVTYSGFNLDTNFNPETRNHEFLTEASKINEIDNVFINRILSESKVIYEEDVLEKLDVSNLKTMEKLYDSNKLDLQIPKNQSVKDFYDNYVNDIWDEATIHDIVMFKLERGLSEINFVSKLHELFFNLEFTNRIRRKMSNNQNWIRFGSVKNEIRNNSNTDRSHNNEGLDRQELNELTSIFYNWIIGLSGGAYQHKIERRPYSEILVKLDGNYAPPTKAIGKR